MSKRAIHFVMPIELLADLEDRTKSGGPFERNFDRDKATCQAVIRWMRGVGDYDKVAQDSWARLRLLLNYIHDRGMRLGAECVVEEAYRKADAATHREISHWGPYLTGQEMGALMKGWESLDRQATLVDVVRVLKGGDRDGS